MFLIQFFIYLILYQYFKISIIDIAQKSFLIA